MQINVQFLDYSFVKVVCESQSTHFEIRDAFSFEIDGARFNPRYKMGMWDGRIRLFENDGRLPIGLVGELKKFANNMDYTISIDEKINEKEDLSREEFDKWLSSKQLFSKDQQITPHWYQADAVYEGLVSKRKILNLPTSAGKSLIQALLSRYYLEHYTGKVLIIVPTTVLVTQMADDFVDYRLFPRQAIQCIGGGKKANNNPDALITVSTWQSLMKQPNEWFLQFGMVINDETHLSLGASLSKIIKMLTHVPFKYGLSGSLRDGKTNLMQYIGMFGDIYRPVTTKKLMEDGQVSDMKINCISLEYPEEETKKCKTLDYQNEIAYITSHQARNRWVCRLALKLAKNNENVFLMFRHTKHGKMMYNALSKVHDNVLYISGETKMSDREEMKLNAEAQSGVIVVASIGVLSTGVSIKNLHHIIFGAPVKAKTTVLQSIGRVLRKHESKKQAIVWDIIDNICVKTKSKTAKKQYSHKNYAFTHALERIKRYADEQFNYTIRKVQL